MSIASSEGDRDSEYFESDDPREYVSDSSDEVIAIDDAIREKTRSLVYDPNCEVPHFDVGMKFDNHVQFKEAVAKYSTYKGFAPRWLKNHCKMQRLRCQAKICNWYLSASYQNKGGSFRVVAVDGHHRCRKNSYNPMVSKVKFLAKYHNARIKVVPSIRIKDLIAFTKIECNAIVKKDIVARARQMVHKEIEGNYKD